MKRIKDAVKVLLGKSKAVTISKPLKQTSYYCPVCKNANVHFNMLPFYYFRELDKHQYIHSIFQKETINIEFYSCSHCGCADRDRLYALYFNKVFKLTNFPEKYKILDIAPSRPLTNFLRGFSNLEIRTADLYMEDVDDKTDIMNMSNYADESFDIFICSHVLEHVENDIIAMQELHRVLNRNGWGIAMVPIHLGLDEVYEDSSIKTEQERWKHFGQHDHLRAYSKNGFITRLESVGFKVNQFNIVYFGEETFLRHGIHPRSVLYIVTK